MTPLPEPVALVTGANEGIGFEVARQVAKSGGTVLLGARNPTSGREAAETLTSERLDVRFVEPSGVVRDAAAAAPARSRSRGGSCRALPSSSRS